MDSNLFLLLVLSFADLKRAGSGYNNRQPTRGGKRGAGYGGLGSLFGAIGKGLRIGKGGLNCYSIIID